MHVTNSLNFGGLERLVVDLATQVDRTRFQAVIACLAREGSLAPEARAAGVDVHVLHGGGGRLSKYLSFRRLGRLMQELAIDVLHTHNTGPLLDALYHSVTSGHRLAVVHTDHNRIQWPDKPHRMLLERTAARRFGGMVAVSDAARDNLHRFERIPLESLQVIDNGVNLSRFTTPSMSRAAWLSANGIPHHTHVIGMVAMLRQRKGIDHLIAAMPRIRERHPDTGLVIAGGGPLEAQLRGQADQLGLSGAVHFVGRRNDVADLLWALDLFILPSEAEGLPLSLLEAMAARRCVVASRVGAIPEVLEDGRRGVLITPGSPEEIATAVTALLGDASRRSALADSAWERVSQSYSIGATVARYEQLYLERLDRVRVARG
jgi:glycosyltransferase involved in cell wall biosynthesis